MAEHGVWAVRFAQRFEFVCIQLDIQSRETFNPVDPSCTYSISQSSPF
jgi:hypothetical protein